MSSVPLTKKLSPLLKPFIEFFGEQPDPTPTFNRRKSDRPLTESQLRKSYRLPRSITDKLPWIEYLPESNCILLDDYRSVGAVFYIQSKPCEGRPDSFLENLQLELRNAITNIPELDHGPWILQVFTQDDDSLFSVFDDLKHYISEDIRNTQFTQNWLETMQRHYEDVAKQGGLFFDEEVTGDVWGAATRWVRAVLYRRVPKSYKYPSGLNPEKDLNFVAKKLSTMLSSAGIRCSRMTGEDFYYWMLRWLNPKPAVTNGDVDAFMKLAKYPGDENLPFGHDFSEGLFYSLPRSDDEQGVWYFDGMAHRIINVQRLNAIPDAGHVSAERSGESDFVFAFQDRLPPGTIYSMTITFSPQDNIQNHLGKIVQSAVGDNPQAALAAKEAKEAQHQIELKNKIYPVKLSFYIRAESLDELNSLTHEVDSMLINKGLQPIDLNVDLLQLDSYLQSLPMAYQPEHDKQHARRSRLMYSEDVAALMPLYGRSRGTGHFGITGFNRGGEFFTVDPLNKQDRKKNGHLVTLGPTGAGKSAWFVSIIRAMMAIHRPRFFIIEAGNSFGLLGQEFERHGISVNQLSLKPGSKVSIPPFVDAIKLLDDSTVQDQVAISPASKDLDDLDDDSDDSEERDLLGEMVIIAKMMITGGEAEERVSRSDRLIIQQAIVDAARFVKRSGREQTMISDVVGAMREIAKKDNNDGNSKRAERASNMADGMELFCNGFAGQLFNQEGEFWPEVDVTIVDMATLAQEGYQDQLTVAYVGLMNMINNLVERCQYDDRPTIVLTDEGHIITTNPLLSPYVVKITKMWRKLGTWYWIGTQNMEDFPDQAKKMLNMIEWWVCLVMPDEEVEDIARFKALTEEEKSLLTSAKKSAGKYTEGVVMGQSIKALFRNVPAAIDLALAMTEKEEKAERSQLQQEHGLETELDAVHMVAEQLREKRMAFTGEGYDSH